VLLLALKLWLCPSFWIHWVMYLLISWKNLISHSRVLLFATLVYLDDISVVVSSSHN
jgi:hypothetical protein